MMERKNKIKIMIHNRWSIIENQRKKDKNYLSRQKKNLQALFYLIIDWFSHYFFNQNDCNLIFLKKKYGNSLSRDSVCVWWMLFQLNPCTVIIFIIQSPAEDIEWENYRYRYCRFFSYFPVIIVVVIVQQTKI